MQGNGRRHARSARCVLVLIKKKGGEGGGGGRRERERKTLLAGGYKPNKINGIHFQFGKKLPVLPCCEGMRCSKCISFAVIKLLPRYVISE